MVLGEPPNGNDNEAVEQDQKDPPSRPDESTSCQKQNQGEQQQLDHSSHQGLCGKSLGHSKTSLKHSCVSPFYVFLASGSPIIPAMRKAMICSRRCVSAVAEEKVLPANND